MVTATATASAILKGSKAVGVLRLFLALCVVAGHARDSVFGMIPPIWSVFSVPIFFVISGFYMAMVISGPYRNKPVGAFYLSRIARLYPAYLISIVTAFWALLAATGLTFLDPLFSMPLHQQLYVVLSNVLILGQELVYLFPLSNAATGQQFSLDNITLNPPAWSISVELIFYFLAPLAVRSLRSSAVFLGVGALYAAAIPLIDLDALRQWLGNPILFSLPTLNYYMFPASFLMFGGGAVAYHLIYEQAILGHGGRPSAASYWIAVVATAFIAKFCAPLVAWWQILAFVIAVPALFALTRDNKLDRTVGELSYPVYIMHFPVLIILKTTGIPSWLGIGTATALATLAVGGAVFWLVDRPVDRWRHRMVNSARHKKPERTDRSLWVKTQP
jgi:peptidoglycan/LPS O-acetylase OafA/YrhL